MLEWDERMHRWAVVGERGWTLRAEGSGHGVCYSIGHGLIEVEFGDRLGIRGIESGGRARVGLRVESPCRRRLLTGDEN